MKNIKITPKPLNIEYLDGENTFVFDSAFGIIGDSSVSVAVSMLNVFVGQDLSLIVNENPSKIVAFKENTALESEEYIINIAENITIEYSTSAGALYAVVSLKQAISSTGNALPYAIIHDKPRMKYRGFMFDTGRYFFEPKYIYKLIDNMVENKLNVFHWHLSEDQGWRVEIDAYPELTLKASERSHTNFGLKPHGGYYKKSELRDIVKYCSERNITVIPELDIPGHTQAMLAAYPYLGCFDRKLKVATHWGVKHDILCAGKETTYEFVKTVLDELLEIFPSHYIHIGGDEAVKTRWNICPLCQAKLKELGLKDTNQLQAHFTNVIAEYLKSKGRETIIWNEYEFSDICNSDIIWMAWNCDKRIFDKIKEDGRTFINANSIPYYIDLTYKTNPLKKVYLYDPTEITGEENMLGIQASLWTEFVPNIKKAFKMIYPRITAIAERAWSHEYDYDDYLVRLETFYEYLHVQGVITPKSIKASNSKFKAFFEHIWFGRRVLYWAGLHNLIDNFKVKMEHSKYKYQ